MNGDLTCDGVFEAKLVRENKSAKGIFLTLEIAADDYYACGLNEVRPNALLRIGYQEQTDTSVHKIEVPPSEPIKITGTKEKRKFSEMNAAQQAGMLCDDVRFQEWLDRWAMVPGGWHFSRDDTQEEIAAKGVRKFCGVKSRADIPNNPTALERWQTLLTRFEQWKLDNAYGETGR